MTTPYDRVFQVCRHVRHIAWMRAACGGMVAILLSFALAAIVDYWLRPSSLIARLGLSLSALASIFALLGVLAWRLKRVQPTPFAVASLIEQHFPVLRDQLVSAVDFSRPLKTYRSGTSIRLAETFVDQVQARTEGLDFRSVVNTNSLWRALLAAVITTLLVGGVVFAVPQQASLAIARLLLPWKPLAWPARDHLLFDQVPTLLAQGESLELVVRDEIGRPPSQVFIQVKQAPSDGKQAKLEVHPMLFDGDAYSLTIENLQRDISFRAMGGDDTQMPWYDLKVLAAPQIEPTEILLHYPAYIQRPPQEISRVAEAVAGSHLSLRGTSSLPLVAIHAFWIPATEDTIPQDLQPKDLEGHRNLGKGAVASDGLSFQFPAGAQEASTTNLVQLTESGALLLIPEGSEGVRGTPLRVTLRVVDDEKPIIRWETPTQQKGQTSRALIEFTGTAHDDFAITAMELQFHPMFTGDKPSAEPATDSAWQSISLNWNRSMQTAGANSKLPMDVQWQGQLDLEQQMPALLSAKPSTDANLEALAVRVVATDSLGQKTMASVRNLPILTNRQKLDELQQAAQQLVQQIIKVEGLLAQNEKLLSGLVKVRISAGEWPNLLQNASDDQAALSTVINLHQRASHSTLAANEGIKYLAEQILQDASRSRIAFPLAEKAIPQILKELERPVTAQLAKQESDLRTLRRQVALLSAVANPGNDKLEEPSPAPTPLPSSNEAAQLLVQTLSQQKPLLQAVRHWHELLSQAEVSAELSKELADIAAQQRNLLMQSETQELAAATASPEDAEKLRQEAVTLSALQKDLARALFATERRLAQEGLPAELSELAVKLQQRGIQDKMRSAAEHLRREQWGPAIQLQAKAVAELTSMLPEPPTEESDSPGTSQDDAEELARAQAQKLWYERLIAWRDTHSKVAQQIQPLAAQQAGTKPALQPLAKELSKQELDLAEVISQANPQTMPFPLLRGGLQKVESELRETSQSLAAPSTWPEAVSSALHVQGRLDRLVEALEPTPRTSNPTTTKPPHDKPMANGSSKRPKLSLADLKYMRNSQAAITLATTNLLEQITDKMPLSFAQQAELTRLQQEQAELAQTFQELVGPKGSE